MIKIIIEIKIMMIIIIITTTKKKKGNKMDTSNNCNSNSFKNMIHQPL